MFAGVVPTTQLNFIMNGLDWRGTERERRVDVECPVFANDPPAKLHLWLKADEAKASCRQSHARDCVRIQIAVLLQIAQSQFVVFSDKSRKCKMVSLNIIFYLLHFKNGSFKDTILRQYSS